MIRAHSLDELADHTAETARIGNGRLREQLADVGVDIFDSVFGGNL